MTRPKNPFPTVATPGLEQVAEVRGMEVRRTSAPMWTLYLVEDRRDPEVRVAVRVRRIPDAERLEEFTGAASVREPKWIVESLGGSEHFALYPEQRHTRKKAELFAVRVVVQTAKEVVADRIAQGSDEERLLGLVAPRLVQQERAGRQRAREGFRRAVYEQRRMFGEPEE